MNTLLVVSALLLGQNPAPKTPTIDDLRGSVKPSALPVKIAKPPQTFAKTITHADEYLRLAIAHLESFGIERAEERVFTRFFLFNTPPDNLLDTFTVLWSISYNSLNPTSSLVTFTEVPGSNKRLYSFDLRKTRWTVESFAAAVRRDLSLREGHCDSDLAERVRQLIGVQQDLESLHVDAIAPAMWLMREVYEPGNRTTAMYDLLYSEERFGVTQFKFYKQTANPQPQLPAIVTQKVKKRVQAPWPGGPYYNEKTKQYDLYYNEKTKQYQRDWPYDSFKIWKDVEVDEPVALAPVEALKLTLSGQQKVVPKLLKDFPQDLKEFQDRWKITEALKALEDLRIIGTRGEIVVGSKNTAQNGSIVSYNDRIIYTLVLPGGLIYTRTLDFKKTSGKSNPASNPRGVPLGEFPEDAGEHLLVMGNGVQTALLTGAAKDGRKRAEFGDAEVVHSSKDPSFGVVKTQFSCTLCHAPTYGFINPSNKKITDGLHRGIRLLDKDPDVSLNLKTFFTGWDEDAEFWRLGPKKAYRALTTDRTGAVWTGQHVATNTLLFRDWYDAPVGLDQAAVELGFPKLAIMFACLADGSIDAQNLFMGETIPRAEWDDTLFRQLALTIASMRNAEDPDPLFYFYFPELLRQTAEKAGKKP